MTSLRACRPQDLLRTSLTNLDPLTENYNIDYYYRYIMTWPSLFTVAENQNGDIVGYIMGKLEQDPDYLQFSENYLPWHGHITALSVAPQYRRLGLAKRLTEAFEQACEQQNAWFVDLFVRESNRIAVDLYKSLGYSVFRRVMDYYSDDPTGGKSGEDAFDMRKPLSRDQARQHVRENGEDFRIAPEDLYYH